MAMIRNVSPHLANIIISHSICEIASLCRHSIAAVLPRTEWLWFNLNDPIELQCTFLRFALLFIHRATMQNQLIHIAHKLIHRYSSPFIDLTPPTPLNLHFRPQSNPLPWASSSSSPNHTHHHSNGNIITNDHHWINVCRFYWIRI